MILIAAVLADATPDDIEVVVSYLSGELRQRRTGLGWRSLQSLPAPATTPSLEVSDVDRAFEEIAALHGAGSATRAVATSDLFARAADPNRTSSAVSSLANSAKEPWSLRCKKVLQPRSPCRWPPSAGRPAALTSTSAAARLAIAGGGAALDSRHSSGGHGRPAHAGGEYPDPEEAVAKTGLPAIVDFKLDGVQVQVHRKGAEITIFTRSPTT